MLTNDVYLYYPYTPVVRFLLTELQAAGYPDWEYQIKSANDGEGFRLVHRDSSIDYWFEFDVLDRLNQLTLFHGAIPIFTQKSDWPSLKTAVAVFVQSMTGVCNV